MYYLKSRKFFIYFSQNLGLLPNSPRFFEISENKILTSNSIGVRIASVSIPQPKILRVVLVHPITTRHLKGSAQLSSNDDQPSTKCSTALDSWHHRLLHQISASFIHHIKHTPPKNEINNNNITSPRETGLIDLHIYLYKTSSCTNNQHLSSVI